MKKKSSKKQLKSLKEGRKFAYTKKAIKKRVKTRKEDGSYKQSKKTKNKIKNTLKEKYKKGELIAPHKGGKLSKSHIKNLSLSHKGQIPSNAWKKGHGTGCKNVNWKGGITPLMNRIRHSLEYRLWRSDVFTRDNFTCQECGKKGGHLEAHHIKKFSKIIKENNIKTFEEAMLCEELWNINNGETLCDVCHRLEDKK